MSKFIITHWKDKEGDKAFADMTSTELQEAYNLVQKRQLIALGKLKVHKAIEEALLKEAKIKKINLSSLSNDDSPIPSFDIKKKVVDTAYRSIIRKENQLEKETLRETKV